MLCSPHEIPQLKYLTQLVVYFIYKKKLTLQHSPHFPTPRTCPMQMLSVCQKPGKKSHVTVANHWKYDAGKQQIVSLFCNSSTAALCLTASGSTATTRTTGTMTRGNNNVGVSLGKCTNPGSNGWHMVCSSLLCHYSGVYRWQSGVLINVVNVSNWYIRTRPQVEAHFYLIFLTPSRYLALPLSCPLSRPLSLSLSLSFSRRCQSVHLQRHRGRRQHPQHHPCRRSRLCHQRVFAKTARTLCLCSQTTKTNLSVARCQLRSGTPHSRKQKLC